VYATGYEVPSSTEAHFGVRRAVRSRFERPGEIGAGARERLSRYVGDMLRPYGIEYRPDRTGFSYGDLAAAVIADVLVPGDEVDLLVLAYAMPDVSPGRATATWLSHICPGGPFAVGICDEGSAIGFAGLRLLRDYYRAGVSLRSLLIVVEQPSLPYDPPAPMRQPVAATAVGLLCGDVTDGGAELLGLSSGGGTPLTGVADTDDGDRVIASGSLRGLPDERPVTGVWWDLAGVLQPDTGLDLGPLLVVDHDPELDRRSTARFWLSSAASRAPAHPTAVEPAAWAR
jgi:hypothetical protein